LCAAGSPDSFEYGHSIRPHEESVMTKLVRTAMAPFALLVVLGACRKQDTTPQASRQVELAPVPGGQPQLADTARTAAAPSPADAFNAPSDLPPQPAPRPTPTKASPPARRTSQPATGVDASSGVGSAAASVPAPAPEPAPPAPTTGVIAGGSTLSAMLGARVCTNTHKAGDRVTASLGNALTGTNGAVIPAGAVVTLRVTESQRGENGKEGIRLSFEPVSVSTDGASYLITGSASMTEMETVRAQTTGDQAKKVAAGALVGALAGQLLGKKTKSTVIGAAVGAAAGGAVAVGSADWNGCLGEGGRVTITLAGPVTVRLNP
jgi:hypothetical protein